MGNFNTPFLISPLFRVEVNVEWKTFSAYIAPYLECQQKNAPICSIFEKGFSESNAISE